MASSKLYVFDEVAKHNRTNDCWLLISGKVYNVSSFMDDHPGGDEVLLSSTGKDATTDFEDAGHSESARDLTEKYLIGEVDTRTVPTKRTYLAKQYDSYTQEKNTGLSLMKALQLFVPTCLLGFAIAVRVFAKKEE